MPNWNPFAKKENDDMPNPELNTPVLPEKTQAELIAESVAAAIAPLMASNASLTSKMEAIEANSVRRPAPAEESTNAPTSVFDDEDAAFGARIGPLAQRQLALEARLALGEVKADYISRGYGDFWAKEEKEITAVLENSPLVDGAGKLCRGDHAYIRNVVDMVIGRAAQKNGLRAKGEGFFIESAGGDGSSSGVTPQNDGLTDSQRRVFQRMGVKGDDAKKTMGKLRFVS